MMVERATSKPLKCICSDNGGEHPMNLKNIILSRAPNMRRRYLTPHNKMV